MVVNYEIQKINSILHDFYNTTGITVDLLKTDFTKISYTKYEFSRYCKCIQNSNIGEKSCRISELDLLEKCKNTKKAQMHICHAGLVDMAIPIIYNEEIIGYIILGQFKTDNNFSKLANYMNELGLETEKMGKYYDEIAFYNPEKIHSVANIASMLVKYILLENMFKPILQENIQNTINYINDNLGKKLTIKMISRNVNVSKSVLYQKFHSYFNCTVNEYINRKRVEKSVELLSKEHLSIEDVSQKVGFASASYYSKTFKKYYGISPLKYRKSM